MATPAQSRLRLWLRSERALGLGSVPVRLAAESPPPAPPARPIAAARAVAPPPPARRPQPVSPPPPAAPPAPAAAPVALFGAGDAGPFTTPVWPRDEKLRLLADMDANEVKGCTKCRLCEGRRNTVFGEGDPDAAVMFVGEGPGETEDNTGRPFVGEAGQLLDKMIGGMGLAREQVFIANIVKCRPPENREPAPDEVATCTPYLVRQIEIVRPKVIVTLGRPASQYMLSTKQSMTRLRGAWHARRGIRLMPTFHPAYVLRQYTPETRAAVWSDLRKVMAELGLEPPPKK